MAEQEIDYGQLVERALRGVVRDALDDVVTHGLPGQHHLYITFRTEHPGVAISDRLLARYPHEMTIVLQHEYWGLEVDDEAFEVTLSFGNRPERLRVPFAAIKVFADPSVEFGLQFSVPDAPAEEAAPAPPAPAPVAELPRSAAGPGDAGNGADEGDAGEDDSGAEVVTLDRFRKK